MPELPEVEVVCRGIRPFLIGQAVTAIRYSGKKLRHPVPMDAMRQAVLDQPVIAVSRRAKFLQISLQNGGMLIIHLGMTGNLGIFPPSAPPAKHDHVVWSLSNGTQLRYNDSRRFGCIHVILPDDVSDREKTLYKTTGPEPFSDDFTAKYLRKHARNKIIPVKQFIMTNQIVAGIGNIYANESLFAAGIRPARKAQTLTLKEWDRLVTEIRRVLAHAIDCGGSTISDFLNASQKKGYFQINFRVYGREGQACTACRAAVIKQKLGGRASFYCPRCQK